MHTNETLSEAEPIAHAVVLIVLVLYQVEASRSPSFAALCEVFTDRALADGFSLVIYDNSPCETRLPEGIPIPHRYIHDPANGGLAAAYNAALRLADERRSEWLLLLDQDTAITTAYVRAVRSGLRVVRDYYTCAALAPRLLANKKLVSPARILWGGRIRPLTTEVTGVVPAEAMALNSATVLRVSTIRELGGFDTRFWLDYLDYWLFNRLYRAGYSLYVLDVTLHHGLSVISMGDMSIARYKNVLSAEGEFYRTCKSRVDNVVYTLRLVLRAGRMLVTPKGARFFLLTLSHLLTHLGDSRPFIRRL